MARQSKYADLKDIAVLITCIFFIALISFELGSAYGHTAIYVNVANNIVSTCNSLLSSNVIK
jgi:hypothetical protein